MIRWVDPLATSQTSWEMRALNLSDFDQLVNNAPGPFVSGTPESGRPATAMGIWAMLAWGIALLGLRRNVVLLD